MKACIIVYRFSTPVENKKKNSTMIIEQKLFRYRNANSLDLENIQDIKKHTRNRQKVS